MADRSTQELRLAVERDRAALAGALARLRTDVRDQFSPDRLFAEGRAALRAQAAPALARVEEAVRAQTWTVAAAGLALVALVVGKRRQGKPRAEAGQASAGQESRTETLARWEDDGGMPRPDASSRQQSADQDWLIEAQDLRAKATALLDRIDLTARTGSAPVAGLEADRQAVLAAYAREVAQAFARGLDDLPEPDRAQIILARERAYLERCAADPTPTSRSDLPSLAVGGALALAGAALGCFFRPTATEDRLFGEARDGMIDALEAAIRDEVLAASDLARTIVAALQNDVARAGAAFRPPGSEQ